MWTIGGCVLYIMFVHLCLQLDPEVHPQNEEYWGHVNPIGPRACYDEGKRVAETMCYAYMKQVWVKLDGFLYLIFFFHQALEVYTYYFSSLLNILCCHFLIQAT